MTLERLLIVDDDPLSRESFATLARAAKYTPVLATEFLRKPKDLVSAARKAFADAVLCDHKLKEARLAGFEGAEGVAALYDEKITALLVTAYEPSDVDIVIRPLRRRIPCLMHTRPRPDQLRNAIEQTKNETLRGIIPDGRRPYRSSLFVDSVVRDGARIRVNVVIPQSQCKATIPLLLDNLPAETRTEAKQGGWLLADVNINAVAAEDLYIDNIRLPPPAALKEFHDKADGH